MLTKKTVKPRVIIAKKKPPTDSATSNPYVDTTAPKAYAAVITPIARPRFSGFGCAANCNLNPYPKPLAIPKIRLYPIQTSCNPVAILATPAPIASRTATHA